MLAAGEASGDVHGAALCQALRQVAPQVRLFGMGGPRMAATGMELLADVTGAAAIGSNEVLGRLPEIWRAYRRLRAAVAANRPAVLVLIDFPEFNLRLATAARRAGVPVVYYIPPQIWAWRAGRMRTIRERVSLVLAVFPFEPAIYRRAGVPVQFVGHPVLDAIAAAPTRSAARRQLGVPDDVLLIGLLPGSRSHEVGRMTPLLREAAGRVASARRGARFLLALAPTVDVNVVAEHLTGEPSVMVVRDQTHAVMRAADLLLVTSGTATLEAALLGAPMVVCYRASRLTVMMGRLLARVPWISLANITLGRGVIPELWRDVTADGVARAALQLLDTPGALQAQREAFQDLAIALGRPGVSPRAARLVLAAAGVAA
jgi:lipid-A-disaccharide synthase